jgi:AcrR family transcriptional regulator
LAKHEPADVRREQILLAAMTVCGDKGYHATRIDDIAKQAGLSKGAIYHHFGSKQAVFLHLLEQMLDQSVEQMTELDASGTSLMETIRRTFETQLKIGRENPHLIRGLFDFYLLSFRDEAFREHFERHYQGLLNATTELMRHGIQRGEVASHIDPEKAARVFMMGGDGVMLMHFMIDQEELGMDAAMYFTELFLRGIASERES